MVRGGPAIACRGGVREWWRQFNTWIKTSGIRPSVTMNMGRAVNMKSKSRMNWTSTRGWRWWKLENYYSCHDDDDDCTKSVVTVGDGRPACPPSTSWQIWGQRSLELYGLSLLYSMFSYLSHFFHFCMCLVFELSILQANTIHIYKFDSIPISQNFT